MNRDKTVTIHGVTVLVLIVALTVVTSMLLHVMFSRALTDLTVELLAAALAVVPVVAMREDIGVVAETTPDTQNAIMQLVRASDSAHSAAVEILSQSRARNVKGPRGDGE